VPPKVILFYFVYQIQRIFGLQARHILPLGLVIFNRGIRNRTIKNRDTNSKLPPKSPNPSSQSFYKPPFHSFSSKKSVSLRLITGCKPAYPLIFHLC